MKEMKKSQMKEMSLEGKLFRQTTISNNKSVVDIYWYYRRWYNGGGTMMESVEIDRNQSLLWTRELNYGDSGWQTDGFHNYGVSTIMGLARE